MSASVFDLTLPSLDGTPTPLSTFRTRVLLIVNVASRCGFTPQYQGLQSLYEHYGPQRFSVLAFPCNQFLFQEMGSASAIRRFCTDKYSVTFPLFAKLKVKGKSQSPLYHLLDSHPDDLGKAGPVAWNFEKFLLDAQGQVVRRFRSKVTPQDPALTAAIESLLAPA